MNATSIGAFSFATCSNSSLIPSRRGHHLLATLRPEETTMRIPMVSALCIAFVSVCFPHPAVGQVNPGDLKSFQAPRPTVRQQSVPELPTLLGFQEAPRTSGILFNRLSPNSVVSPGWHQDWRQFGTLPQLESCTRCAHMQIYEAPDIDPKIIVERIPSRLLPLVPPSDPDRPIYRGLPLCPKDFHPFLPIHP